MIAGNREINDNSISMLMIVGNAIVLAKGSFMLNFAAKHLYNWP